MRATRAAMSSSPGAGSAGGAVVGVAQDAEDRAQLAEGVVACRSIGSSAACGRVAAVPVSAAPPQPDVDLGEGVCDDVVQFAGDP